MKGAITNFMRQKRGFEFKKGTSCDCKDLYRREFDKGVIIMSYMPCKGGKPHRSCPGMYRYWEDGNIINQGAMPMSTEFLDRLLKDLELIPEDTKIEDAIV